MASTPKVDRVYRGRTTLAPRSGMQIFRSIIAKDKYTSLRIILHLMYEDLHVLYRASLREALGVYGTVGTRHNLDSCNTQESTYGLLYEKTD
jgi:hypothetical protein